MTRWFPRVGRRRRGDRARSAHAGRPPPPGGDAPPRTPLAGLRETHPPGAHQAERRRHWGDVPHPGRAEADEFGMFWALLLPGARSRLPRRALRPPARRAGRRASRPPSCRRSPAGPSWTRAPPPGTRRPTSRRSCAGAGACSRSTPTGSASGGSRRAEEAPGGAPPRAPLFPAFCLFCACQRSGARGRLAGEARRGPPPATPPHPRRTTPGARGRPSSPPAARTSSAWTPPRRRSGTRGRCCWTPRAAAAGLRRRAGTRCSHLARAPASAGPPAAARGRAGGRRCPTRGSRLSRGSSLRCVSLLRAPAPAAPATRRPAVCFSAPRPHARRLARGLPRCPDIRRAAAPSSNAVPRRR